MKYEAIHPIITSYLYYCMVLKGDTDGSYGELDMYNMINVK